MTALLGCGPTGARLGGSATDVLSAVRRFGSDLDRADAGVESGGDGVLHGEPRGLFGFDGASPGAHGLTQLQQFVLIHVAKYATPMWLARGNPVCHTDVAVNMHVNVATDGSDRVGIRHEKPKGRSCSHRRYQLNCQDYDLLLDRARNRCEICSDKIAGLVVDHDARIGDWAVRGLLCNRCNSNLDRLRGVKVDRYLANGWYLAALLDGDATATRPAEPAGPVWDPMGRKWVRRGETWQRRVAGSRYWYPSAFSWPELYRRYGPRLTFS